MRLASQFPCLGNETSSILVRGAEIQFQPPTLPCERVWDAAPLSAGEHRFDSGMRRYLRRRVMVTGRASKTRREGSIPSRRARGAFDEWLHLLRWPCASFHGMRVRPPNHRVSRVHRPLLGVGTRAHEQEPSSPRRPRHDRALILRGRDSLRRSSLGERAAATILGRYFNSRILLSHSKDQGATPCRSTAVLRIGVGARIGERLDGIEKVAGAIPVDSTKKYLHEEVLSNDSRKESACEDKTKTYVASDRRSRAREARNTAYSARETTTSAVHTVFRGSEKRARAAGKGGGGRLASGASEGGRRPPQDRWHRPRVRTSVFQTDDTGANPVARSTRADSLRGPWSAKPRMRV